MNVWNLFYQGVIGLVLYPKESWHFLLLDCTNKASFHHCDWGPLRASSMLFGVRGFSVIRTSIL